MKIVETLKMMDFVFLLAQKRGVPSPVPRLKGLDAVSTVANIKRKLTKFDLIFDVGVTAERWDFPQSL